MKTMTTTTTTTTTKADATLSITARLMSLYANAGLPCTLDAGPVGIVVYAATRERAAEIADRLVEVVRMRDPKAFREPVVFERDELPATAWVTAVHIHWERF